VLEVPEVPVVPEVLVLKVPEVLVLEVPEVLVPRARARRTSGTTGTSTPSTPGTSGTTPVYNPSSFDPPQTTSPFCLMRGCYAR
jgi:hypothetical protein